MTAMDHLGGGTPEGEEGAVAGMELAYSNAPDAWKVEAYRAVEWLAYQQPEFTPDDVWDTLNGERQFEPLLTRAQVAAIKGQALGSIMRSVARAGVIKHSGTVMSSQRACRHKGTVAIWKSLKYEASSSLQ